MKSADRNPGQRFVLSAVKQKKAEKSSYTLEMKKCV
jgi:hypothetical protein